LHLTAIFYITCYGLCLFFFQLIELPINIINELDNHNQYPGPWKFTIEVVLPSFTIISSTNKKDNIKINAIPLNINDVFDFFLNKNQETNNRGLASQGKAGICNINTPSQPKIKFNNPEKYSQVPPTVQ
jgi:hypothetical protein